ncbi:hypothetical protein ACIA48_02645 [Mycobacterium sp. NPDC051804]|uniref:hypothetical protein n=1 Tax=Mycobacterium sp. NPDC051804 TaxID=3364295 RepID=UPI0037AF262B
MFDGTVIWTCPQGQTYTTHPGSRLLFPTLCRPTAPIAVNHSAAPAADPAARGMAMPRRKTTRAQNRADAINDERRFNKTLIQAEAEQRARERQQQDTGTDCESVYSPSRPPPSYDDDPPF